MSQPTTTTITLARAELRALVAHAGREEYRANICLIAITPDGRAFSTDGHRLIIAGPTDADLRAGFKPRECATLSRVTAVAMLKGSRKGDRFEITIAGERLGSSDGVTPEVVPGSVEVTITDRHEATRRQSYGRVPGLGTPPPADQVIPGAAFEATDTPGAAAVSPAYLAEGCKAFADLESETAGGCSSIAIKIRNPLDPVQIRWTGDRQWCLVIMPMRADHVAGYGFGAKPARTRKARAA